MNNKIRNTTKEPFNIFTFIIDLTIVFSIYLLLSNIAKPNIHKTRPKMIKINCFSEIRVLSGAVELYNLDNESKINELNDETIKILFDNKYIKEMPNPFIPKCVYRNEENLASNPLSIYCEAHGSPDGSIHSIYDEKEIEDEVSQKINSYIKQSNFHIILSNFIGAFILVIFSRIFISGLFTSVKDIISLIVYLFGIFISSWVIFISILSSF